jgi:hypothetical protein
VQCLGCVNIWRLLWPSGATTRQQQAAGWKHVTRNSFTYHRGYFWRWLHWLNDRFRQTMSMW